MSPDRWGFDHLISWGALKHSCTEDGCNYPDPPRALSEEERKKHFLEHEHGRNKEQARKRRQIAAVRAKNLAKARDIRRKKREDQRE